MTSLEGGVLLMGGVDAGGLVGKPKIQNFLAVSVNPVSSSACVGQKEGRRGLGERHPIPTVSATVGPTDYSLGVVHEMLR